MSKVAVIGAGSWGTAFTGLVAKNADEVSLWCHSAADAVRINAERHNPRYLADYVFAGNVCATHSFGEAVANASAVVMAVPSTHLRSVCEGLAASLGAEVPVLVLTKGIEPGSGLLMTEVAGEALGNPGRVAGLSGPNHAEEVCRQLPAAAVIAGEDPALCERLRSLVATPNFRVYVSDDVRGVELCGAVKNVVAIACGMCVGYGCGDNTLALVMTRGLAEIGRVVRACGGNPMTCMGLAGMGDLVATCTSEHSRNRRFGEAFVRGATVEDFERQTHMVVEGAHAVRSLREVARAHGVEVPLADAVWAVLYDGCDLEAMGVRLMGRAATEEFYGMAPHDERRDS